MPEDYSSFSVLVGILGYSVQILCDFSGYSDLAAGIALLLGFRIPNNFNRPYSSLNIQEFWRRWHITLSHWLRDYLYVSLGGNRKGNLIKYFNLMLTMIVGGLWHGAGFQFIIWGFLHGGGLVATHIFRDIKAILLKRNKTKSLFTGTAIQKLANAIAWIGTFLYVSFAWIFFKAESMNQAMAIISKMVDWKSQGTYIDNGFVLFLIALILFLECSKVDLRKVYVEKMKKFSWLVHGFVIAFLISLILRMGPDGIPQFIYFQF
jgi:D-alanyl-lipoteichoic acid acyltransferase DltB (MBOAT superfamily)